MRSLHENPYSPPISDTTFRGDQEVEERDLATLKERFAGNVIDSLLSLVVFVAFTVVMEILPKPSWISSGSRIGPTTNNLVLMVGSNLIYLLIQAPFLWKSGQTLGKRALGTAIVDLTGKKPSLKKLLLLRYGFVFITALIPVAGPILLLADSLWILTKRRRCLHDYVAGTKVVSLKRKATTGREEESSDRVRDREKDAELLDTMILETLGLERGSFSPNADFMTDLRIPRADLLSLYDELEDLISVPDMPSLERCRSYSDMKKALDLP